MEEQLVFRAKATTKKASHNLIHESLKALNDKLIVGGIVCDLQKAFEHIIHNTLFSWLKLYGITDKVSALRKGFKEW